MALPATETFTNSDGTVLTTHSSNWSYSKSGAFEIQSNQVRKDTGGTGQSFGYWNADTFNNDQYAEADWIDAATGQVSHFIGPAVRISTNSADDKGYVHGASEFGYQLHRVDAKFSFTTLSTDETDPVSGDLHRIEISGSAITCYAEASQIHSTTDSTYTSGAAGIGGRNDLHHLLDNWEGGNLGAAAGGDSLASLGNINKRRFNTLLMR